MIVPLLPPGLKSSETKELIKIANENNVIQMVGLQRRFYSHILEAKSIIEKHGDLFSLVVEAPERFTQIKDKNNINKNSSKSENIK